MNEKDVLGLRLLPGITGKMESIPHWHGISLLCKKRVLLYCSKVHVLVVSEATFQSGRFTTFLVCL